MSLMNALTTNLVQNLQPSSNLSSQLDNTQSEVTSTITHYTHVVLVALLFTIVLLILRLRYPCFTLSELRKFVDELNDTVQKCAVEEQRRDLMDHVSRLQRQIDDIEYEWSRRAILQWSSVYGYLRASLIAVRNIVKCYDRAQALHVYVLDVIAHERRVRDEIEDQYRHTLNSERNRRRDTNDADTVSFGWITSLQGFRTLRRGDQ
ncbi:hypothetical protein K435DRAFT_866867 [Dendrothele bispora CBS 962.96]|uniref:Uncharacterized protein n=1 Tax=Dendrothele bispora (strain CBS 962.96) TaxID=1314807 RepID=A0A4S8KY27_DENBC|nr:hypothetical protein K435DRAFT_873888 [Dendrothele bispora CBS 962.96]THU87817.1 hypothetical protein K435DRAFT_866867 [Dendrothele bispora CBS 962.96]